MKSDFTRKLLLWNKRSNKRAMPWKGEKDPYKIWLSEIILQQTRVEQGWAYYEKFIVAFPSIRDLAKADDKKVFKMWEGLGYYTRCKNLLAAARKIVNDHKGKFPSTYEAIKALPGIGPYTAAAISSFAFNEAQAVVDGNVQRVIARYFGISTPVDTTAGKKLYQSVAQALLDQETPGIYNQAIMDFGAVICKPQNPLCDQCVQRIECEAFAHGLVKQLPVKEKSIQKKSRWFCYYIIELKDRVYIRLRTHKDIWENLHEFVLYESDGPPEISAANLPFITELIKDQHFEVNTISRIYRQALTHQTILGQFIVINVRKTVPALKDYLLVTKKDLPQYAFPRLINTFLDDKSSAAQLF
jgi:A/G-specific adenine glycosylase